MANKERSLHSIEKPNAEQAPDKLLEIAASNLGEIHIALDRVGDDNVKDAIRAHAIELGNALNLLRSRVL